MVNWVAVINMKEKTKGMVLLLITTLIWGSAFVSQSIASAHLSAFAFQAMRCLFAVAIMLPIIAVFDRFQADGGTFLSRWADKKLWKAGIACGIPLFLASNLQQLGIADTQSGKAGFLTAMYIVIVPIFGVLRGKKLPPMTPLCVLLAVAGLYFLSCAGVHTLTVSDLLLIGCALLFAVQISFVDVYASKTDGLRLNAIQILVCGLLSALCMPLTGMPTWQDIGACLLPLAHTGFLSMGLAYGLQILAQKHLDATTASLIMSLESVFAVLFGMVFLHERLDLWEIIGCVLMFAAVILSQIPARKVKSDGIG